MPGDLGEEGGQTAAPHAASDVFVSYASQDAGVAHKLVETLERHGIRCWIAPRDVKAGAQYADAIIRGLTGARVMVLVLSAHSIASSHVGKEIERASSKKRPIIALRTDSAPLTPALEYFLSESQWIEVNEGKPETAYAKLIDAIRDPERDPPPGTSAAPTPAAPPESRRNRLLFATGLAIVAIALAAFFGPRFWPAKHSAADLPSPVASPSPATAAISAKSIAVLPFVDMSEKHDQEYFSDGLSEELIDHLAHIPDLKVIARTSSFAFKGKNEDMRTIATKLGVANLLEGSVRKAGEELRITAQLIRASDGVHLWSEIYDRKLIDIFKLQDEISTTVAHALNAALNSTYVSGAQLASNGTASLEAYNLLLQGNFFYARSGEGDFTKAIALYQQALAVDPHYARAWARLALTYGWQGVEGELPAYLALGKGKDAAQRALAIDTNCAEAYFARGNIFRMIMGDWSAAKADYERAATLDPRSDAGEMSQGYIFDLVGTMGGRFDEFIDWARRRLVRDPLDIDTMDELAWHQQFAGQLEESVATGRRLLELSPAYVNAHGRDGLTLLLMGKYPEALAAVEKEPNGAFRLAGLAAIYWAMDRHSESDSAVVALERDYSADYEYQIAFVHAYRNELDAAFAWLDRAYQHKRGSLQYLRVEPGFRNLRGDRRFDALLRKVKLIQ